MGTKSRFESAGLEPALLVIYLVQNFILKRDVTINIMRLRVDKEF
jgi:hypothetical protein